MLEEFLARDVIWSSAVLTELNTTTRASRSHFANLFDMKRVLFHVETPPTASTQREVEK